MERIRLNNQDVYIDGRWVGHISISGNTCYGALPGRFFQGKTQMEVAEQMMAALDETRKMDGALAAGEVVNSPRETTEPAGSV